ncbi:Arc family DNA-binding protein [Parasegetibacter sp. NRK P23]|uniref:Arc family DNA-binding protein n=1 Tax=Parasegetibacter sp. NRK P23 TaxID=2942999 RepID=UPI002044B430|nr:Arc family DNA-binding protein [Parasegetibacter sp. NRK P23]MCM5527200.1 Arc family DNA-binding protein [Parasegetibacter sp. NRK P23]
MSAKKNFVLRLDAEVYNALEKWAADEFRSVNGQLEWLIHQQLKKEGRMPKKKESVDKKTSDQ